MVTALDLASGKMFYRIRDRKSVRECLGLLKPHRARSRGEKLCLIADNHPTHKHAIVKT